MNLTRFLVGRPWLTAMPFGAVVVMGAAAAVQLPVSDMPSVEWPALVVMTSDPGASAVSVKHDVTDRIEDAISELGAVKRLTGISATGSSTVQVELTSGTDVDIAAADITQAINGVKGQMPDAAGNPRVMKFNLSSGPVLVANFSGTDLSKVSEMLDRDVAPALRLVEGVGSVTMSGDRPLVTDVVLDPDRLIARGLTVAQVRSAITAGNRTTDAGAVDAGGLDSPVRLTDQAATRHELARLVVGSSGGHPVQLSEVATLNDAPLKATSESRMDGQRTVSLSITPKSGSNVVQVAGKARETLEKMTRQLPAGTRMVVTDDRSVSVKESVLATATDLALAVLLASLVVLIFLQSFRQTVIVLIAIPTSLLATTFMMKALDFSIDVVSLLAMSLLIGILVDDAVVVIENITRHLGLGKSRVDAAVDGRTEIGGAAVALTLVDVVVFLPIAVTGGIMSDILMELAMTVVVATLFSLLVSFTLTPMLAARWLKPTHEGPRNPLARGFNRAFGMLEHGYVKLLRASLHHRITVLLAGTCCMLTVVGIYTTGKIGVTALPEVDTNTLYATVTVPSGTTLESRSSTLADLSVKLRTIPDVVTVYGRTGAGEAFSSSSDITMTLNLVDKLKRSQSKDALKTRVTQELSSVPGAQVTVTGADGGGGNSQGVSVLLTGPALSTLDDLSRTVTARLKRQPNLTNVKSDISQTTPSWDVKVDPEAAARLGVTTETILATVAAVTENSQATSTLSTASGRDQDVTVSLATGADGIGIEELKSLPVAVQAAGTGGSAGASAGNGSAQAGGSGSGGTGSGSGGAGSRSAPITLGQVATVRRGASPAQIIDSSRQVRISVTAAAANGATTSQAEESIKKVLEQVTFPNGYGYTLGGAAESESDMFFPLLVAVGMAPILIYMLLAALYESLVLPFAVLLAQPLAVFGAFLALMIGGSTLNIFSMIGMVLLIGLVSKNGILLIDRTEQQRRAGLSATEALAEAGRVRLRPILMTTMTLVIAMLPIAVSQSSGSEQRAPLALVLIGGMTSSTILTLLIVPTLYTLMDGMRERLPRGLRGLLHGRVPGPVGRWLRGRQTGPAHLATAPPAEPGTLPSGIPLDQAPAGDTRIT